MANQTTVGTREILTLFRQSLGLLLSIAIEPYGGLEQLSGRAHASDERFVTDRDTTLRLKGVDNIHFVLRVGYKARFSAKPVINVVDPSIFRREIQTVYDVLFRRGLLAKTGGFRITTFESAMV